jgi:hypothetical protein
MLSLIYTLNKSLWHALSQSDIVFGSRCLVMVPSNDDTVDFVLTLLLRATI